MKAVKRQPATSGRTASQRVKGRAPLRATRTGPQLPGRVGVSGGTGTSELRVALPATYATYRALRADPTVALARAFAMAPILSAEWSLEIADGAPADVADFVRGAVIEHRAAMLKAMLAGTIDYGWQSFEIVLGVEGGYQVPVEYKPLLQDLTTIVVETASGAYSGVQQYDAAGNKLTLGSAETLLVNREVEGTNWYGLPLLENVRKVYTGWTDAEDGAARYDKRIAGSHWVIHYPPGKSKDENGVEHDNYELATAMLTALESSGRMVIPRWVQMPASGAPEKRDSDWKVELLSDATARQPSFIDRLRYLDSLKVRALLLPERAVLEGQFGTRAEAVAHGDAALTIRDLEHRELTDMVQWQVVRRILRLNYGAGSERWAKLVAAPLASEKSALMREAFQQLLANPATVLDLVQTLDFGAILDALGLPRENLTEPDAADTPGEPLPGMDTESPDGETAREAYATEPTE